MACNCSKCALALLKDGPAIADGIVSVPPDHLSMFPCRIFRFRRAAQTIRFATECYMGGRTFLSAANARRVHQTIRTFVLMDLARFARSFGTDSRSPATLQIAPRGLFKGCYLRLVATMAGLYALSRAKWWPCRSLQGYTGA